MSSDDRLTDMYIHEITVHVIHDEIGQYSGGRAHSIDLHDNVLYM